MNLLPQELKQENRKRYNSRLLIWGLVFLLLLVLISITLLVPSYLVFTSKRENVEKTLTLARSRNEVTSAKDSYAVVADVNKKILTLTQKGGPAMLPSELIDLLLLKRTPALALTTIHIQTGARVSLEGVARSREALTTFKESLEGTNIFKQVDSPISNLIADKDINFSITAFLK